ncbi:Disulfide-bond oxidoreductase YfcG [Ephemeroptericola cinctiostellae]|uniref:Disulfide-bond oxidoreductase YfcG n=1 Tax=Ephemeroptericola cinctiostellae TaxID=2268024 RepID=A0A345D8E9_9BURK|nr:glutathione S-transferase N-terminal domain-containing protein [Ephemeroptericola cinctiostellae]AXF84637.1 Disulfide-bond oxidoreductase YfcG [Ephemeroptericola cinctiostellae]
MIQFYTYTTPNGRKISIMLEELGIPYQVNVVNISNGEQFEPDFLKVSPNNKIPAIVDEEANGLAVFESGAILTYLAEKYGQFLPTSGEARYKTLEWLHWQIGGVGPMFGQLGYFTVYAKEKMPQAIARYTSEAERLLAVMDRRLTDNAYLAGEVYSIADMAAYPWVVNAREGAFLGASLGAVLAEKPAVLRWLNDVGARPAVQRGMAVPVV